MALRFFSPRLLTSLAAGMLLPVFPVSAGDLRDAAPPDAFMAIYGMHNPERDYQRPLHAAVFQELENTKLIEKVMHLVQSKLSGGDAEQFVRVRDALRTAVAPIEWEKLGRSTEVLYTQRFRGPTSVQLFMMRVPDGGADSFKTGIVNLFELAAGASQGNLKVVRETIGSVEMSRLQFPQDMPVVFQPAVGVSGDVVVMTTSLDFARESLDLLANPSGVSKFDDPRFSEALKHLPNPEDSIVFFDGKAMASQLQEIPVFIERTAKGQPEAQRVSAFLSDLLHQIDAFDYEVTVEFTEGFQNKSSTFGKRSAAADKTVLGQMLASQQKFENWTSMVPASASGFSLSGGASLLPLYEWVMQEIPSQFPEAQPGLDHFAQVQDQFDIHLKEDLLEAFTGGFVSLTLPGGPTPFGGKSSQSVTMLRCAKPERIQELIHRGFNALSEIPQVQAQGIGLKEVPELEGFEEITANMMAMTGARPVIGFRDGWMVIGSSPQVVETSFAIQQGEGEKWSDSDRFREFGLSIEGPVHSISYANTGESIRNLAAGLQQAGMMGPMIIGMAGAQSRNGQGPDLKVLQDILGLLPSVGRVLSKLDFQDATLSVTQPGADEGTYLRHAVTLIRVPKDKPASRKGDAAPKAESAEVPK